MIRSVFVEKRTGFNVEAKNLMEDLQHNLQINALKDVRILNKYLFKLDDDSLYNQSITSIFSEPPVDMVYETMPELNDGEIAFGVEFLPGQYDQRADSAAECFQILNLGQRIEVKSSKVIILKGKLTLDEIEKIKKYYINPVESREVEVTSTLLEESYEEPEDVKVLNGFIAYDREKLTEFHKELQLAMSIEDLELIRDFFKEEGREPSFTEIKVIDTYWSDHCRHTTFSTNIKEIEIDGSKFTEPIKVSLENYKKSRDFLYGEDTNRPITLMDLAVISMKELRKKGLLDDLDVSEEINACSIKVKVTEEGKQTDYLVMFKNETHNHPTEIEPFGGAATCLGGAIRDPLSGRTFVYQAMRVTGAADPTVSIADTLKGKLPQRKITLGAAHGYSSYGNQIGLATGQVSEVYHPQYVAKRMEIGAVVAAAPAENVRREEPKEGDVIILLGGKTGRDGCGGATGSSKEHTTDSLAKCGAEVQKGNAPTERKLQRLFRNPSVSKLIKRCNDFGAGGVSVAIGELCRGLDINLDLVPKKYEGLDGTELAISESQERMAVVVEAKDEKAFIEYAEKENLQAVTVAKVTSTDRLRMFWRGKTIVDLKREFLDTNGATQYANVRVNAPKEEEDFFKSKTEGTIRANWEKTIKDLNVASQKGMVERFDSTIGGRTVLMPFGGKTQLTPAEGMAAKVATEKGMAEEATIMTFGYNPYLSSWSPYHGAYYAVIEAVTKMVACGGKSKNIRLTFQEYFEKLAKDENRWGKPFSALLGAYEAQAQLDIAAIGGKDSMSGSFENIDVPPTLVAFAIAVEKAKNVISPEFKKANSKLVYVRTPRQEDELIDIAEFRKNMNIVEQLIEDKKVLSAYSIKFGGIAAGISKMSFGNHIGAELNESVVELGLFDENYGSMILEVEENFDVASLNSAEFIEIGRTIKEESIKVGGETFVINDLIKLWEEKLNSVFEIKTKDTDCKIDAKEFVRTEAVVSPAIKVAKPRVLIPVFPGTNCEDDCTRAFEKEGAIVNQIVINNLNKDSLNNSLKELETLIKESQIIMLPGGFSAGDEPDGSGKFIANIFRNERVKIAVMDLLKNRDGLMLGICNGFQALIKLGLVPYGEILDINEEMPTLTYNNIGRHMSSIVNTKILSNKSPWFNEVKVNDIHQVAISHGEGRFVASEELIKKLLDNGQVATQYVDLEGKVRMDMPYNPNGSMLGIEGITSPCGRVLGKMGHSERIGENLYKNVEGNFDQKLFKSGVNYFK
ncbi:phosphoribosylformylglycinamidine synthase [Inconstantimicrobium mannanitabidum]|uniref:Phosphoribosylformylglycinamidine synthase n=1 Tax=Inconstantimicrobium mannanitabidum TaxID=1604901 RepID=A0ACB5RBT4_9CLOT|nr:phosphoribosylformylglycinamidine synthase [Clostridium sp. TW13]GKX66705.1 phosphoribosylformylglycinamidine synthase [Clostridium sp. TW13]